MAERPRPSLPFTELTAITPLDGRYRERVAELAPLVSEYSLIRNRIEIEARYLLALSEEGVTRIYTPAEKDRLYAIASGDVMNYKDTERVKQIETETRHDVKAMERTFRNMLRGTPLVDQLEMIHMGLTSEDVNNLAYRLQLKRATDKVCVPVLDQVVDHMTERAEGFRNVPMLGRTHGQAAVPTTVGKEFAVFAKRLNDQVRQLEKRKLTGKLTGSVGNFNALQYAYPERNWIEFSERFVSSFGFEPNFATTQINMYEDMIEMFQSYQRINNILIDFNQDMWRYISDDWFVQEVRKGEVGSSTMPQKVNPIDFENSEGNLGMANATIDHLTRKLSISRLQRDLSDSTTIRNIGPVLGYSLVGYKSVLTGMERVHPNKEKISDALNRDWAILGEGVQTLLRKGGVEDPYTLVASMTRGEHVSPKQWGEWVDGLPVNGVLKKQLADLTPEKYIGLAEELTDRAVAQIRASRHKK